MGAVQLHRAIVAGDDLLLRRAWIDQLQQVPLHPLQQAVAAWGYEAVMIRTTELEQLIEKYLSGVAEGGQQRIAQVQGSGRIRPTGPPGLAAFIYQVGPVLTAGVEIDGRQCVQSE